MLQALRGSIITSIFVSMLIAVSAMVLFAVPTDAAINNQINFQGKITNPNGTNVTNGSVNFVFKIYTVASGGVAVWTETKSLTVTDGIFQTALGDTTALPGSVDFNNASLYLGITVAADAEMTPRVRLTSAPYAFNSNLLNGLSSDSFVQLAQGIQSDASTTNSSIAVNKTGTTANILQLQRAGTDVLNINNSGSYAYTLSAANNPTYTITNNGTSNITTNLASTGDFIVQDNGVAFASFLDNGGILFAPTAAGDLVINQVAGSNVQVTATAAPNVDQVAISNAGQPNVTAGVNGLSINYIGGAAAVEASGARIDFTPGTTTGGVWSGMRIVESTAATTGVNSYGLKLESGGTGAGNSYGIGITTGWDIGVDIQSGGLQLATQNDPTAPTGNNLKIYAKDIAGRVMPKWIGPAGVDTPFQASFGFNRIAMMSPAGSGTNCSSSLSIYGSTATGSAAGSATGCTYPALTSTNLRTSVRRMSYPTATTTPTIAYQRQNALMAWRGNSAGVGGFFYTTRFGLSTTAATNRVFVGLSDSIAAPTNIDPTTSTTYGKLGMAINAGTGNWNFINNITGTAPTIAPLGVNFPVNTTDLYELVLFSAPNGSSIGWRVTNLTTGTQTSGSVNTNIPSSTTFLAPVFWASINANGTASTFETAGWYIESDN